MLLPYVENDVSAFYTVDEFTQGVNTLKEFCLLRAESIVKQLNGEITKDSNENYVDASHLNLSDLGSQADTGMGQDFGNNSAKPEKQQTQSSNDKEKTDGSEADYRSPPP